MKLLRLLLCSVVLALSLGLMTPVLAQSGCGSGQIPSSCGCYEPGIMQTPPCAFAQIATDGGTEPGQTQTLPNSDPIDLTSSVEAALIALLLF